VRLVVVDGGGRLRLVEDDVLVVVAQTGGMKAW
jgi:hypothetical protein